MSVQQGVSTREPELVGDFAAGDTCREATIDTLARRGRITVHFEHTTDRPSPPTPKGLIWHSRLFGPKVSPGSAQVRDQGYGLVLRLKKVAEVGETYVTEVGTVIGTTLTWVDLSQCELTAEGLTTPAMRNRPRKKPNGERPPEPETGEGSTDGPDSDLKATEMPAKNPFPARLPLDGKRIVVRPIQKGTMPQSRGSAPLGRTHRLSVELRVTGEEGVHKAMLWFPAHVGGLNKHMDHGIVPPAWIEMQGRSGELWDLSCEGLTLLSGPEQDVEHPEPAATTQMEVEAPPTPTPESERLERLIRLVERFTDGPTHTTNTRLGRREEGAPASLGRNREFDTADGPTWPPTSPLRMLKTLEGLGERWLELCLADVFTNNFHPANGGVERKWLAEARERTLGRMTSWPEVARAAAVEQSSGMEGPPNGEEGQETENIERMVLRFLGLLALLGREVLVSSLVERACRELVESQRWRSIGWVRYVAEHLEAGPHSVTHVRSADTGPKAVRVVIRDQRDRVSEGEGKSDERALQSASRRFAEQYLLTEADQWPTTGGLRGGEIEGRTPYVDQDGARSDLVELLRERGLSKFGAQQLLQGLEDRLVVVTREGEVVWNFRPFLYIGLLGELLRMHAHAVDVLRGAEESREGAGTPESVREGVWSELLRSLLAESSDGATDAALAPETDLTERVMVAILTEAEGKADTGAEVRRKESVEARKIQASLSAAPILRSARPESLSAEMSKVESRFLEFGELFDARWGVRLDEGSVEGTDGRRMLLALRHRTVSGETAGPIVHGTAQPSRAVVASVVMGMLDRLAGSAPWKLEQEEIPLARLLMRLQLETVPFMSEEKRARCREEGYLGLGFLRKGDLKGFHGWAEQVEQLCGKLPEQRLKPLAEYYTQVMREDLPRGARALNRVCGRLARELDRLGGKGPQPFSGGSGSPIVGLVRFGEILRATTLPGAKRGRLNLTAAVPGVAEQWFHYGSHDPEGRPVAPGRRVSQRETLAIAYLLQVLGAPKDADPVRIQVRRASSGTMVIVSGVEEPLSAEQQDLVDMVVDVIPSLKVETKGSTRTIKLVPGMFHGGLAAVGAQAWGLAGHQMEELLRVSNDVDKELTWSEDVLRNRVLFGALGWRRIQQDLARFG